ncbi:MAG: cobalamin-binding protein [Dehalococcoidia bacterium]
MKWQNILISLALIFTMIPLAACVETEDSAGPPSRIISLSPSNTEILFALNLGDSVVGVTEYCDYPPQARQKPTIGGFSTVDTEKVIELDPDLVLASGMHEDTVVPQLRDKGIRVLIIDPQSLDEIIVDIALVGVETGRAEESSLLNAEIEDKIEAITEKTSSASEKPDVFYVTWHDPIWTLGKGTLTHELIEKAGGTNVFADARGHLEVNLETVVNRNPRIILASAGHGAAEDSPVTWARTEERLRGTDARQNDRIYQIDADLVTRAGPRAVDGLEMMARIIHPELFEE